MQKESLTDPLVRFSGRLDGDMWEALRRELGVYAGPLIAEAERQLAADPRAVMDPNAGLYAALGVGLGLVYLQRGEPLPERYDVFLRMAAETPPEDGDAIGGNAQRLALLVEILAALPMARREAVVVQHGRDRLLAWSLARRAGVCTPAVAERAVWKLEDLGARRNGGGTYARPELRREELALFATLGAVAVPALVRALASPRSPAKHLLPALGRTGSALALAPLCAWCGKTTKDGAAALAAAAEVVRAVGDAAAFAAVLPLLGDRDIKLRAGAAQVLGKIGMTAERRALVVAATGGERDRRVLEALARAIEAPPEPLLAWLALRAAWEERAEADLAAAMSAGRQPGWSDEQAAVVAVLLFIRHAEGAPKFHAAFLVADELIAGRALSGALRELLAWGLLAALERFTASAVDRALDQASAWHGGPPRAAIRHAISRVPGYRAELFARLRAAAPYEEADVAAFIDGLADSSAGVRRTCVEALVGDPARATAPLRTALAGARSKPQREAIAEALTRIGA